MILTKTNSPVSCVTTADGDGVEQKYFYIKHPEFKQELRILGSYEENVAIFKEDVDWRERIVLEEHPEYGWYCRIGRGRKAQTDF
jgi:hypothetical protein